MTKLRAAGSDRRNPIAVLVAAAAIVWGAFAFSERASAQIEIDITRGFFEPLPVAVTDFYGELQDESDTGREIAGVVAANLERSGLFRPIDPKAFIQTLESLRNGPRFGDWRLINAQALVSGLVQVQADGRLRVEFRLWDVFAETQMTGLAYFTTPANWRRVAHIISDAIYKRLTGEDGYFDTRIVYIAESGVQTRRQKRLAIMDQDGANHRFLTDGSEIVLTPRFSPTTQEITYMVYRKVDGRDVPRVYLYNLNTGQQEVLGQFPGMTFAPRFAPDGNTVILSMALEGNSDVYTLDLRTREERRLTNHPAIDTSPSFAPDGQQIVFNSDRSGRPQLYVMDSSGRNVRRISQGSGSYYTPVWSPRGDWIAFTRQHQGEFYIGVMKPDGSGERMIVKDYNVEAPTWAPNGRVISFFRSTPADSRGNFTRKLYTIDVTGYNERELVTPIDGADPAWSPLIP
jgi:TolB protein